MADLDDLRDGTDFGGAAPAGARADFHLKGLAGQDWGMRARLSRIFDPADGKTVMLAFDHGYFQGPTSGLERLDRSIVPLVPQADALMLHPRRAAHHHPRRRTARASCCAPAAARAC